MRAFYKTILGQKKINQDSLIIKKAKDEAGNEMMFLAVCDGMGGLSHGEMASAKAVEFLSEWFDYDLLDLLKKGLSDISFTESIASCLKEINSDILEYSVEKGVQCGTTVSGVFLYNNHYATFNIGDSRVYRKNKNELTLLTHDQSFVQMMIDRGEITSEEAVRHPKRSVLLQCLGVDSDVSPDFTFGRYEIDDLFLVCSDGLMHKTNLSELMNIFTSDPFIEGLSTDPNNTLKEVIEMIVGLVDERKERDNITGILGYVG